MIWGFLSHSRSENPPFLKGGSVLLPLLTGPLEVIPRILFVRLLPGPRDIDPIRPQADLLSTERKRSRRSRSRSSNNLLDPIQTAAMAPKPVPAAIRNRISN